jgi:ribonuclease VapC
VSDILLDASALLALLRKEAGWDRVMEALPRAAIGAVNLAEVVAKLQDHGMPDERIRANIEALELPVEPFDASLAIEAGLLRKASRSIGLSLGDRACLALGAALGAKILTSDQAWRRLDLGIDIEFIR